MNSDLTGITALTVTMRGSTWKGVFNIAHIMTSVTVGWIRDFVRLYLWKMPRTVENMTALKQIMDWFDVAIQEMKARHEEASKAFVEGYRCPLNGAPSKWQERINTKLKKTVVEAKADVDKIIKRKDVFIAECDKRHLTADDIAYHVDRVTIE